MPDFPNTLKRLAMNWPLQKVTLNSFMVGCNLSGYSIGRGSTRAIMIDKDGFPSIIEICAKKALCWEEPDDFSR